MTQTNHILIIDDTPAFLNILTALLKAQGYEVHSAENGQQALALLTETTPDLILTDIRMPEMDGFELIRRLKAGRETRDIPIIFLSAMSDTEQQVEGFNLGAVDFISKPFQKEELTARVRTHLELRRLRDGFKNQAAALQTANDHLQREIEEHKKTEAALRESERRLSTLIGNLQGMVFFTLADSRRAMQFVSGGSWELTGYGPEELVQNASVSYDDMIHPDHRQYVMDTIREAVNLHGPYTLEYRILDKQGTEKWVWERGLAILDETTGACHLEGFITDITERKALESQLGEVRKLEAIGRLAGGVAHDFNNMLGVILANSELVMEEVDPGDMIHACLRDIKAAAEHSADLTRQLLAFARKQTISPRVIDLNAAVENMLKMLRRLITENVDLIWRPGMEIWPVKADTIQIDQILANLCINARDAIEGHGQGEITIETKNVSYNDDFCSRNPGFIPGEFVLMTVSDNGPGMDETTLANLFEPFFTTKEQGKGTGMGLATVYGIIKQNNGFIHVISQPGRGATFQIHLPRHIEAAGVEGVVPEAGGLIVKRGRETILMVEDEVMFLEIIKRRLEKLGYVVMGASTPYDAIRIAGEHAGKIDLLITDVVMPEMNGQFLAEHLQSIYPRLKCLFMSGYTADIISKNGIIGEGVFFIQKPFSIKDLAALVREVLRSS